MEAFAHWLKHKREGTSIRSSGRHPVRARTIIYGISHPRLLLVEGSEGIRAIPLFSYVSNYISAPQVLNVMIYATWHRGRSSAGAPMQQYRPYD